MRSKENENCSTWNNSDDEGIFADSLKNYFKQFSIAFNNELISDFVFYYKSLVKWNKQLNLTRITKPDKAALHLFADSALAYRFLGSSKHIADIGTGGGFPGLVLSMLLPDINFTLIDASFKKLEFIKYVVRSLKITNVNILHGKWPDITKDKFDLIISKATFSNLKVFSSAKNNLTDTGKILLWRNKNEVPDLPGFTYFKHIIDSNLFENRCIVQYSQI